MGQYKFTATFSKIGSLVSLGVVDTQNKNDTINDNIFWYRNDSLCRVGGGYGDYKKGSGFKTGEKVTVCIDLKEGSIQWKVGSEIRCQETLPMLKDNSITWVPYIWLGKKDDSVEISEE